jgi:hypothetical protein
VKPASDADMARERPILFSTQMVRAILGGRKTQSRRVVTTLKCPYGLPGDRLWVRETWQAWRQTSYEYDEWEVETDADRMRDSKMEYRATSDSAGPWRPSIFMPRWASRITLEITQVLLQRLQDISEDDARAEGVTPYTPPDGNVSPDQRVPGMGFDGCRLGDQPHRLPFSDLWDSINGKRAPWSRNPWVWAITFRRLA